MSRTNETKNIKWHETCKCECRLDAIVCNNKQCWNNDKCRCECKKLIDKGVCVKGFLWNPNNFDCECDKLRDIGEYLNYKNCKSRKRLVDKLDDECDENIDEVKIVSESKNNFNSCILYIVFQYSLQLMLEFLFILFTINTWIIIKNIFLNMIMFIKQKIINIKWKYQ